MILFFFNVMVFKLSNIHIHFVFFIVVNGAEEDWLDGNFMRDTKIQVRVYILGRGKHNL